MLRNWPNIYKINKCAFSFNISTNPATILSVSSCRLSKTSTGIPSSLMFKIQNKTNKLASMHWIKLALRNAMLSKNAKLLPKSTYMKNSPNNIFLEVSFMWMENTWLRELPDYSSNWFKSNNWASGWWLNWAEKDY